MNPEIIITSPTGQGLRNDPLGLGFYGAPRGNNRKHGGCDFLCVPGQDVVCPIESGKIVRVAYPYNDQNFKGVLIEGRYLSVKLFYCDPWTHMLGKRVKRGEVVAIAQDISARYGKEMEPHIHLMITALDPEMLIDGRN